METHFAVVDDTVAAFVHEFNGVFNSQDMVFAMRIGIVNQGCQSRRFAAPSWTGHQHETFRIQWQFVEDWWQAELLYVKIVSGIWRNTAATPYFCTK